MNADEFAKALNLHNGDIYAVMKISPPKGIGGQTFQTYNDIMKAYPGTWGKWRKTNKSKGSPNIKDWLDGEGTMRIETLDNGEYIWHCTKNGITVPYVSMVINGKLQNVFKLPDQFIYLQEGVGRFVLEEFTGDRTKDMNNALKYLKKLWH